MKLYSILSFFPLVLISVRAVDGKRFNDCIQNKIGSNRISIGGLVGPGEAICDGDVQFGVFTYEGGVRDGKEYTEYRVELRRDGKLIHMFRGISIPSTDDVPFLSVQHDGNLLFGYSNKQPISGCINLPGRDSNKQVLELAAKDARLTITDGKGDVVWTYPQHGDRTCYPFLEPTCYEALYNGQRISWDEYVCTYDLDGKNEYQLGLDITGSFGLFHNGQLVYRPKSSKGWIRGQYLHFQNDGHLTLYNQPWKDKPKSVQWSTSCVKASADKLVLTSDGDALQLDKNGKTIWSLMGSRAPTGKVDDPRDTVPTFCYA